MSTTNVFQGMDTGAKPSSRVLAPPGGGSSHIFGESSNEGPAAAQKRANNTRNQSDVLNQGQPPAPAAAQQPGPKIAYNPITGQPYETQKPAPAAANEKQEVNTSDDAKKGVEGAENKAPEAGNKGAGEAGAAGVNSDNFRSTRVSQPPGGRSTALW